MKKLWCRSMTVTFQDSKEVLIAKAEVGKAEHFQRGYIREVMGDGGTGNEYHKRLWRLL